MFESKGVRALALSSALTVMLTGAALAQRSGYSRRVSLPSGTVLRAELNDRLSSTESRPGERFTGTIRTDTAGLPPGTQVVGRVVSVRQASEKEPAVVDVDFSALRTPDGRNVAIDGRLTSLDSNSVKRTSSGRLESKGGGSSFLKGKNRFIGYGAGAGALIGALTGGNLLKGALMGALGGYLYQTLNKDKEANGRYSEVNLKSGTEFGVELTRDTSVLMADNSYGSDYDSRTTRNDPYGRTGTDRYTDDRYTSDRYRTSPDQRTSGSFQRYGSDVRVMMNDREMSFTEGRPFMSNGHLMVPVAPVMTSAGYRYRYDPRYRDLTVTGDRRDARITLGDRFATVDGERMRLDTPAEQVNGVVYVPTEFLEMATDIRANWDPETRTLRLTTSNRGLTPYRNDYPSR